MRDCIKAAVAICMVGAIAVAPMTASAQASSAYKHRQSTKNTWRNVGIGSAAVGLYGLLSHQSTLGLLGAAGAGYSAYRYEQDRKSQRWLRDHPTAYNRRYYPYGSTRYSSYGMRRSSSVHHSKKHKKHHVPQGNAYGYWRNRGY